MTVLVELGLLAGATVSTDYLRIGHATYGLIGTGKIAPAGIMADYSSRIMSMSVQRTSTRRAGPLIEYNAGTATVVLLNDDGALDPWTLEQEGLTAPGVVMRIRKRHNGVIYPVWKGFIDSLLPSHVHPDHATVTITGTDGFGRLAQYPRTALVSPVGGGEDSGARINRILDSAGWPTVDRDIATGDSTLQATDMSGTPLSEAQRVTLNEAGEFYVTPDGRMRFRNRHAMLTETRSNTSQATFGSDTAAGEIMYVDRLGLSNDRGQLVNVVRATRVGGTEQEVVDADSVARYGEYPYEESALLLETDTEAAGWAQYVLRQDRRPEFRITSLTLDGRLNPDVTMPQALGREFGDRITVVRRPTGGIVDSREVIIRSIEHTWSPPDQWRTSWGLQPADRLSFFVIGHPTMGVLGANAIAY